MSIETSSFVLGLSMGRGNGIRKLILLGYANHTDKHGRGAYPSTGTIADYAECDVRTAQRHIGWLIDNGYLKEGDQRLVDHLDPRYRPIVYDVATSDEQVDQWASVDRPPAGSRARAAQAGRRGGHASSLVSRGDNLTPLTEDPSPQVSRGDNLSPPDPGHRGDNDGGSGVTHHASRGDNRVTRTIQEPPQEPSSSFSPSPARAAAASPAAAGGGRTAGSMVDVLGVLPDAVRDHPSVVPSAIVRRVRALEQLGWQQARIRERLAGIETADQPGAAALTRLADLSTLAPPRERPKRPPWCGHCDRRTRLRESVHDARVQRCPDCHPRAATPNLQHTRATN
jgi:Helix-turn-helix domain